jgi:hypothetical protein
MPVEAPEVQATPPSPEPSRLGALLEWSKPYRETIAVLVAVTAAISGAVSWVVAHFATQAEVQFLECRMMSNTLAQLLPIRVAEIASNIDWRMSQVKELAQHGGGTPDSVARILDLTKEINDLNKAQTEEAAEIQKRIDEITTQCIKESPKVGSKS